MDPKNIQNITILGATGTIGIQTLDVISRHQNRFSVFALTANTNVETMLRLCCQYRPKYAVMLAAEAAIVLEGALKQSGVSTEVLYGEKSLIEMSSHQDVDVVMAAIVGAAGLQPTMAAAKAGKRILLANKETLVMAGSLFMQAATEGGATLLPIDSEHNAVFQVMPTSNAKNIAKIGVNKIILTASGGPFRNFNDEQLQAVTVSQALQHPNWVMGAKITIDSATMMNKGLEVIEAHWLFNAPLDKIEVVVHPQSVIHSMVEYIDGSVLAQLGNPDMRTPIAYALGYPERITSGVSSLDFMQLNALSFEPADVARFPCLRLAYEALKAGGTAPTILNAVNEVAVSAFLKERISFLDIPKMIESALQNISYQTVDSLQQVIDCDTHAREYAQNLLTFK